MGQYIAPRREMQFVLHELLDFENEMKALPPFAEVGRDLADQVLDQAGKFCEEVLFPLNRVGDQEGCHYADGVVTTPKGFKEAYRQFKRVYLPKLVSGAWTGTMCLTEPQGGSDLAILRTRAEPNGHSSYKLTGTKIFVSSGEHDLTENIVHLVLARLPDAPPGTKGISLFVVPKFIPDESGNPGERNRIKCGSIEHKMGIHGNSTCVMNLEDATGFMVGHPNKGLQAMFVMMNGARLAVGMQGLGLAEVAYQNAAARLTSRRAAPSRTGSPSTSTKPTTTPTRP